MLSYYNITFKVIFKVGNPQTNITPQEHIHYNYSTDWEDQLVSFGEIDYINGVPQTEATIQSYTYDSQGNPTTISNFKYENYTSSSAATLSWSGRELTSIYIPLQQGDDITIEYTYNDQGYRTKKVVVGDIDSSVF